MSPLAEKPSGAQPSRATPIHRAAERGASGPDAAAVQRIIGVVEDAWRVLEKARDLSPENPDINRVLSKLVETVTEPHDTATVRAIMDDRRIRQIQQPLWEKLSASEGAMESWWTARLLKERRLTDDTLNQFWYRDNYKELTELEVGHWASQGKRPGPESHVVFVGSGPLPLTAIELHKQTGARITCIDNDPEAVRQSRALLRRLNLDRQIKVVEAGGEQAEYKDVTHAMVAALVPNQPSVVKRVLEDSPAAMIGVRSANGLRGLLYPPADTKAMEALGLTATGGSPTNQRVINTMLTFNPGPSLSLKQIADPAAKPADNCSTCRNHDCPTRKLRFG
jgi:hypothetical protein